MAAAGAIVFACGESAATLIFGRILLGAGMACKRKHVIFAGLAMMAVILTTPAVLPIDTVLLILFALFFGFGFSSSSGQIMYAHIRTYLKIKIGVPGKARDG